MLILQILALEPAHGYGIAQRIEQISRHAVQVNQGSLGREARFYALTRACRKQLALEKQSWERLAGAVRPITSTGASRTWSPAA